MSESDRQISPSDYLLYKRCPRSLHVLLAGGTLPAQFPADDIYHVASERSQVRDLVYSRYQQGVRADDLETGSDAPESDLPKIIFGARCSHGRLYAEADIWRRAKDGTREAVLVREGTSIKEAYFREAAILDYCFARCEAEPARILIAHVNKAVERDGAIDASRLITERDVTRRVRSVRADIRRALDLFLDELDADPLLAAYADTPCKNARSCSLCSLELPPPESGSIESLHRGGSLISELKADGYLRIVDVPPERLNHRRQQIQRQSLLEDSAQIDRGALRAFLHDLEYPRLYLDFEATSTALPPFDKVRPWEHVPYLYSLHRDDGRTVSHTEFIAAPGTDGRRAMVDRLVHELGPSGSIVVYSAGFERGVLSRLAEVVPEHSDELALIQGRIVDLLTPFSDFAFYHHEQRGKVSLKTVLPILTMKDYSQEAIQDGYTANLAYRFLSDRALQGVPVAHEATLLHELRSYCRMDTRAMVEIVAELEKIADIA